MKRGTYNRLVTVCLLGALIAFVAVVLFQAWERRIMRKVTRHIRAQQRIWRGLNGDKTDS